MANTICGTLFSCLIVLLATINLQTQAEYSDFGWLNIQLYHALSPNEFKYRGNITITNLNTGAVQVQQVPLSAEDRLQLKGLAGANKLYRLKTTVSGTDGQKFTYLTSSRACDLVKSQLSDMLWVSLDHIGSVLGISQTIVNNDQDCSQLSAEDMAELHEFETDVYVKHIEMAPVPDTASFIQKLEMERLARERGETKDNRGFFAKYWMYIVPVAVLVLISSATNPEAAAQNNG